MALPDALNNAKHSEMISNARSWITQLRKSTSILNNSAAYLYSRAWLL